jgi:putative membrane protein
LSAASIAGDWSLSPVIVTGLLLTGGVYAAGWRRQSGGHGRRRGRGVLFYGGLALLYLCLQSPLDALSDHLFCVHQLQHLLLLEIVPVLLLVTAPQGRLIAGMPSVLRRAVLAPLFAIRPLRRVFGALTGPAAATLLFVIMVCLWNLPSLHDAALHDELLHELMHATMLLAGLVYWWRILDPRPSPPGVGELARFMMLQTAMMAMTLVGGYLMIKGKVLYDAYDRFGLIVSALTDEAAGGAILWLAGGVMPLCITFRLLHRLYEAGEAAERSPEPLR